MLRLREVTAAEAAELERLARSRTAETRLVERARLIALARTGQRVPVLARNLQVSAKTVRQWLRRFTERGLDGLADAPRSGRPRTYSAEVIGEVIAASLTKPQALGLPFASWTLDRLAASMQDEHGVPIKRGRLDQVLRAEGLRWRRQETWFSEQAALAGAGDATQRATPLDPEFAQKRGPSCDSTRCHLKVVW